MQFLIDTVADLLARYNGSVLVLLVFTIFTAGLARGFSGFGGALIFVPMAAALVGPAKAGPILLIIDFIGALGLLPAAARRANRAEVGTMVAGALIGVPAGAYLLVHTDPVIVRWVITGTALAFLLLLVSGWRYGGRPSRSATSAVGALAGVFSGAAQLGGPPVVAYWLGGQSVPAQVRANLVLFFALTSIISAVAYTLNGLMLADVFLLACLCAPLYWLGLFAGARSFGQVSETTFRRACYLLIAIAAVSSLPLLDPLLR